jgi:Site-specific recombinases, DNA invertase Pin homologs
MNNDTANKAVLYMRCAHFSEGDPIAEQREALTREAANHGLEVAGEYVDAGCSGLSPATCPQLRRLLGDAKAGLIAHVIIRDISRLSRGPGLWPIVDKLRGAGVALHCAEGGFTM